MGAVVKVAALATVEVAAKASAQAKKYSNRVLKDGTPPT